MEFQSRGERLSASLASHEPLNLNVSTQLLIVLASLSADTAAAEQGVADATVQRGPSSPLRLLLISYQDYHM